MYHKMIQWLCQLKISSGFPAATWHWRYTIENQTVTIENVRTLSDNLAALPKDANQNQLAEAIAEATLVQIAAVSNHGDRITGSAERAVAAWFNEEFPLSVTAHNWFEVEHRDNSEIGKTIAPAKKEVYTAWKSSNPSVKYGRVKGYGRTLAEPMLMAMIAEIEDEADRAEAYLSNDLADPSLTPDKAVEDTTTTSKNT